MNAHHSPISPGMLEQLRNTLENLPPKPRAAYTRQETVKELETLIRHAVSNLGYSIADIAAIYKDLGTEISASTISSILRDLAPKPAAKKTTQKRKAVPSVARTPAVPPADPMSVAATQEAADPAMLLESEEDDPDSDEHLIRAYCPPDLR